MGFTLAAEVSTSTESALVVGSGTSSSYFRFSGPPYSYNRTAFTLPSEQARPEAHSSYAKSPSTHLTRSPDRMRLAAFEFLRWLSLRLRGEAIRCGRAHPRRRGLGGKVKA